jgi:hypothetical protein
VADKNNSSNHIERNSNVENYKEDRHNENARISADLEPDIPKINTEKL